MMPKILAASLAFVSMVANSPGYTPPDAGARSLAADAAATSEELANTLGAWTNLPTAARFDGFDIDAWLDRASAELNAGRAAWSQLDLSTLDLSIAAPAPTGDASRTLFAAASFENPERIARLAALDPWASNQFSGGFSRGGGAAGSGQGKAGGSGTTGSGGDGSGSSGGKPAMDEGGHNGGQDAKDDSPPSETGPSEGPAEEPGVAPTPPVVTSPALDLIPLQPEATPPVSVPEPASMGLLGLGLIGMSLARRRRAKDPRI